MKRFILILMLLCFSATGAYAQVSAETTPLSAVTLKKVSISPNPANAEVKLTIEGKHANLRTISIYSIIGNEVFNKSYNTNSSTIDLDVRNLKKGKYMVRAIFEDNTSEVVTLIKQ